MKVREKAASTVFQPRGFQTEMEKKGSVVVAYTDIHTLTLGNSHTLTYIVLQQKHIPCSEQNREVNKEPCCSKSFILAQGKTYKTVFCSCQTMFVFSHMFSPGLLLFYLEISPIHLAGV